MSFDKSKQVLIIISDQDYLLDIPSSTLTKVENDKEFDGNKYIALTVNDKISLLPFNDNINDIDYY